MLNRIKDFFNTHLTANNTRIEQSEHRLHIATAALLLEVARADFEISAQEKTKINTQMEQILGLSPALVNELTALAELEVEQATSLHQFTSLIHANYSLEEKVRILYLLWHVAYSENDLDKYEESLIRKISDLLYIPHQDFITTKLRAEKEAALHNQ